MSEMRFDPLGGITIVVQDETTGQVFGEVKREGRLWRGTTITGHDLGLFASPQTAILEVAGNRVVVCNG